ncbi:MAG: hypothetical protein WCC90_19705 [Methylocella sp.]
MSELSSIEEELIRLKSENARLRRQQEAQVGMVRVLVPELTAIMPTQAEMKALLEAIIGHWPRDFESVEHGAFDRAFRILGGFHRQADLDHEHSVGHWVAAANERLSRRGEQGIRYMDLIAGMLGWGDIAITDWRLRETEGVPLEFSLNEYVGKLPCDEWHRTLAGKFMQPIDPRPKRFKASPKPSFMIDGRPLPDSTRFVGPRYWYEY